MEIHIFTNTLEKGKKENEAQVDISLARYLNYNLYILYTFACYAYRVYFPNLLLSICT